MPKSAERTTTVSTKGQVVLPKEVRERHHWTAGTRLSIKDTEEGVLLQRVPIFSTTRPEDVFGMLKQAGPPKSLEDMAAGIAKEARRRHARGRY